MVLLRASKIKLTPYDFSDLQLAGKVDNIGLCPTGHRTIRLQKNLEHLIFTRYLSSAAQAKFIV